jgi:glycosyltransferase involved in cell wall biosynthesis
MIVIDRTHMGRRASGIERITEEQFSQDALAPLPVAAAECSSSRATVALQQTFALPARALRDPASVWVFPGYPPSPAFAFLRERAVVYIHDLFLMTRRQDLNTSAKIYSAAPFTLAVKTFRYFLTNSLTTAAALREHVGTDAVILPYRPEVRNVFGLAPRVACKAAEEAPIKLGCVGTVEPRKNYRAAARICSHLAKILGQPVELHIIGRPGWGSDYAALAQMPHVRLHGFLPDAEAARVIGTFDVVLSTSHDEGLGLPLLELQYAGMPAVAPDQPVFREVLGPAGTFIDPADERAAALTIAALIASPDAKAAAALRALQRIAAWNEAVRSDRLKVIEFLFGLVLNAGEQRRSWSAG